MFRSSHRRNSCCDIVCGRERIRIVGREVPVKRRVIPRTGDRAVIRGEFGHLDRPVLPSQSGGEIAAHPDRDHVVTHTVKQSERDAVAAIPEVGGQRDARERVGDHERACQTDGVPQPHAEPCGVQGRPSSGDASQRPPDENEPIRRTSELGREAQ